MTQSVAARRTLAGLVALAASAVVATAPVAPVGASGGSTRVVRPGQSIQAAIDQARPGDRIVVRAGTYAENVLVTTPRLTVAGQGAVLVPPPAFIANICSGLAGPGTEVGICVAGADVELADFVVEHRKVVDVGEPVADVAVTGMQVRGFSGAGIALVGAARADVQRNDLVDNGEYGALTAGSRDTRITGNTVRSTGPLHFIGICMDDVTPVRTARNDVSGYDIGLCIQTQGADVRDNEVHDVCIGAFVDPGIAARVRSNHIAGTHAACIAENAYGITGIAVTGDGAVVQRNRVQGIVAPGSAGIAVTDFPDAPPAAGNLVTGNVLTGNTLDLLVDAVGGDNVVVRNRCTTSSPAGLC